MDDKQNQTALARSYIDVEDREWALATPEALHLLENMPRRLARQIANAFLAAGWNDMQEVQEFFISNSSMSRHVTENPGSSLAFETWYTRNPRTAVEWYSTSNKAGSQLYKRLLALKKAIPVWLTKLCRNGERLLVDNIGSGPGRDMVMALDEHPLLAEKVHVRNIDPDLEALEIGRRLVRETGLENSFSFVGKRIDEAEPRDADLLLLIGILCPVETRRCAAMLRKLRAYCRPGGIIIYSTPLHTMVREDPLADFLMRIHGWHMCYKTPEESAGIGRSAGWEVLAQFFDEPLRFHCMTVARRK